MRFWLMLMLLLTSSLVVGQDPLFAPPVVPGEGVQLPPASDPLFQPPVPMPGAATITPMVPLPDPMFTPPLIIMPDANEILVGPYEPPFICEPQVPTVDMFGDEEVPLDESNSTQEQQCCSLMGQMINERTRYDWVDEELDNLAEERNEILLTLQAILAANPSPEDRALAQELADDLIEILDEQVAEKELELELIAGNITALQELWLLIGC